MKLHQSYQDSRKLGSQKYTAGSTETSASASASSVPPPPACLRLRLRRLFWRKEAAARHLEEISRILSEAIDQTHEKAPELFVEDAGVAQPASQKLVHQPDADITDIFLSQLKSVANNMTAWWFGTFFIFPYIGNNQPN